MGAVAVSETNPDLVFLGTGETCIRGNIMPGDGVYRSRDAGETWEHVGFGQSHGISKIRIHPTNPDIVYVASFGKYSAPSEERGVFKSSDGGETWRRVLYRNDETGAIDIVIDRNNPNVLYAALWEAYRKEYQMSSGGPGSGMFKSTDAGETWTEITRNPGMPQEGVVGRIGLAVSSANSDRVYSLFENDDGGLFRSDDAGATWELVNDNRAIRQRAFYYTHVFADHEDEDVIYMQNTSLFRSSDGGESYETINNGTHGDFHDFWIDPDDASHLLVGNDGGGAVSTNTGESWTDQEYSTSQFYHAVTTAHVPFHVCGSRQDNSTLCLPSDWNASRFDFGRADLEGSITEGSMDVAYRAGGGEPGYIAPDPTDLNIFYSGRNNGRYVDKFNRSLGTSREVNPYPWFYSGGPITGDMNGPEVYATIFSVGPGKVDIDVIWTGSDDGLVHVTSNGGATWTNVTPSDMPDFGRVSQIDASPFSAGRAYVSVRRPLLDDFAPYIWKTDDYGQTWTKIVNGIREDAYVHAIREDPNREGLLYAGTQHGVYISYDDGANWQELNPNLPDIPVIDVIAEHDELVIGTHGRGFWVLDNAGPLRQATPNMTSERMTLFEPAIAYRSANGATLSWWFAEAPESALLEVLDERGEVVRTYEPADEPADTTEERDRWASPTMPVEPGLNVVRWNLQTIPAATFPGMILWGVRTMAPVVPPGQYTVRLTADGQIRTAPLTVERNPWITDVTDADLQAQYEFGRRIRDKVNEANAAVIAIRRVKAQLADRLEESDGARLAEAGGVLTTNASDVEANIYQVRNRSGQDPLNFPIKVNNRLANLLSMSERGDGRPMNNMEEIFQIMVDELRGYAIRLEEVWATDLDAVNRELERLGLERLDPLDERTPLISQ